MNAAVVPILPAVEIKRILYATDFSDASRAALPVVGAIARHYGARIYAAHVWSPPIYPMLSPEVVSVMDRRQQKEVQEKLEKLLHAQVLAGTSGEAIVRRGAPAEQLERAVREQNIGLVVASTHGVTGFRHRVLGSVAEELVRSLSCPVLTVGPRLATRFEKIQRIENILFPTDFSEESLAVFPYLASLAHEYHSRLTVLHVLPRETAQNPEAKTLAEPLRKQMEKALYHQISPRCSVDFVIDSGDAAETILAYASRGQADLIGLGVRCATDIAKHFRETIAYRVLAEAECPVLTHHGASRW
ncbi:MAG TPA: universal stress protein [Candidatus Angelobacter sp.]